MEWPGLRTQVREHVRNGKSCQINKRRKFQYGHLPKTVTEKPWEALCVDLIGSYRLKEIYCSMVDCMSLTVINPATGWFEMIELPTMIVEKHLGKINKTGEIFNKNSKQIAGLVNKSWFWRYPRSQDIVYDNGSEFKLHVQSLCDT